MATRFESARGFVLGKFLPPHRGHQLLVDFARRFCGRTTVLVCSLEDDPIPGEIRAGWMREMFPDIDVLHLAKPMPQEPKDHPDFWAIWRSEIRRIEPREIGYVFASEPYGQRLAKELGARFIPVDVGRELRPFSGTAVRSDPMGSWDAIPECVRPWFVRRVCLFGPESTGKSTLARRLADHFGTVYAWEHARPLLDPAGGRCEESDIDLIARSQIAIEEAMARQASRLLVCDTSTLLTTIWSQTLFGRCPEWILDDASRRRYDLVLLLDVDVPWVDDEQRYFPDQPSRLAFFERCRAALEEVGQPYLVIRGGYDERFEQAKGAIEPLLESA